VCQARRRRPPAHQRHPVSTPKTCGFDEKRRTPFNSPPPPHLRPRDAQTKQTNARHKKTLIINNNNNAHSAGRTFVSADSSGRPDLVCDPLAVAGSPNTLFELDASYYGWQGCRCQDPAAHAASSGAGVDKTLVCAADPGAFMLPASAIAAIIVVILGSAALLLLAGWLAWRFGLVHALAQWRVNAAKRRPPGQEQGKEVTLVLTDVEGSTELWEWDADVASAAIALHDRLLRSYISRFYGYEVTTEGDAFLVAFHDAFDAAAWCLTVQLALMCEFFCLCFLFCFVFSDLRSVFYSHTHHHIKQTTQASTGPTRCCSTRRRRLCTGTRRREAPAPTACSSVACACAWPSPPAP
jgi:hypothetical protein